MTNDLTDSLSYPSTRERPVVLIPTARSSYRLLSYGTILDFEDVMREGSDADLVDIPAYSRRARLRSALSPGDETFARVPTPRDEYDLCFFVAMEPSWVSSLRYVEGLREKCRKVIVYVFDAWLENVHWLRRHSREWNLVDVVYVSFPWAVEPYSRVLDCRVEYLPQAARAARFHPFREERPIQVLSVGRRLPQAHSLLLQIAKRSDLFYHYSETMAAPAISLSESQDLLARLCQSAQSQVCWPVELTNAGRAQEGSPVTVRWFEAASCGSIVFGCQPAADDFSEIFPYDDFVLGLDPGRPEEFERKVSTALSDQAHSVERQKLAHFIRTRHSWEARRDAILDELLRSPE